MVAAGAVPCAAAGYATDVVAVAPTTTTHEGMRDMPLVTEKGVVTVTGSEDWDQVRGFGKDSGMAQMMTLMMVGGSGMEHMRMGATKPGAMNMNSMAMSPPAPEAAQGLPITVTLSPNPPVVGDNTLDVAVTDANGAPVTGLKLIATVSMTSMDMGTAHPKVVEGKGGHYTVTVNFSMKGPWQVVLNGSAARGKGARAVHTALDFDAGSDQKWVQPGRLEVSVNTPVSALKVGTNNLDITILDPAGKPVTGATITAAVAMTSMDMGTTHPQVREGKDGHYTVPVEFSMKGPWRVTLMVTPPKAKPSTRSFDFDVQQ